MHPDQIKELILAGMACDHLALDGERIHVAPRLPRREIMLAAGHAQFDVLLALLNADLSNTTIGIDRTLRRLLEVIAILDDDLATVDA